MGIKDFGLLGGFVAIAIFGYFMMAKVDQFLDKIRQANDAQEPTPRLNIAISCVTAIPAVSNALADIRRQYPNVHCDLCVGHEQEVIRSFERGEADVAIISADSGAESKGPAQWNCTTLSPQSFSMDHGIIEVKPVEKDPQHQKVLWKSCEDGALVLHFVRRLCGQQR